MEENQAEMERKRNRKGIREGMHNIKIAVRVMFYLKGAKKQK